MPFERCLSEWVLRPLGLTESSVSPRTPSAAAVGYTVDRGRIVPVKDSAIVVHGAGDLMATARDIARLVSAAVHGDVISPAMRTEMLRPNSTCFEPTPGHRIWQGLGVRVEQRDEVTIVGHEGTWQGFSAAALADTRGTAVAAAANTHAGLLKSHLYNALTTGAQPS